MPEVTSSGTATQFSMEDIVGGTDSDLTELSDEGDSGDEGKKGLPEVPSSDDGGAGKVPSPRKRSRSPRKPVTASSSGEGVKRASKVIHSDSDDAVDAGEVEESASEAYTDRVAKPSRRTSPKERAAVSKKPRDRQAEKGRRRPARVGSADEGKAEPPKPQKINMSRPRTEDDAVSTKPTHGDEQKATGTKKLTLKLKTSTGDRLPTPTSTPTADQQVTPTTAEPSSKRTHSRLGKQRPTPTRPDGEGEPSKATEGKRKPERKDDERRDKDERPTGKVYKRAHASDDSASEHEKRPFKKSSKKHGLPESEGEGSGGERRAQRKAKKKDRHLSPDAEEDHGRRTDQKPGKRERGDVDDPVDASDREVRRGVQSKKPTRRDRGDTKRDEIDVSDRETHREHREKQKKVVVVYTDERRISTKSKRVGTDDESSERPTLEKGAKTPKTPRSPGHDHGEDRGEKPKRKEEGGDVDRMDTEGKAESGKRKAVDDESGKVRVRKDEEGREREGKNESSHDVLPKKKKNRPAPSGETVDAPSSDIEVLPHPSKKKHVSDKPKKREDPEPEPPVRPRLQKRPGEKTARRVAELGGGGGGTRTPGDGKPRTPLHRDGGEVTPLNRRPAVPKKVQYDPLAAAMSSLGAGGAGPSSGVS
jgi:hypothetical protein